MRVRRLRLRPGSGGVGRWRGGDGIERDLEVLEPVTLSLITERRVSHPWGLDGGGPGATGRELAAAGRRRGPHRAAARQGDARPGRRRRRPRQHAWRRWFRDETIRGRRTDGPVRDRRSASLLTGPVMAASSPRGLNESGGGRVQIWLTCVSTRGVTARRPTMASTVALSLAAMPRNQSPRPWAAAGVGAEALVARPPVGEHVGAGDRPELLDLGVEGEGVGAHVDDGHPLHDALACGRRGGRRRRRPPPRTASATTATTTTRTTTTAAITRVRRRPPAISRRSRSTRSGSARRPAGGDGGGQDLDEGGVGARRPRFGADAEGSGDVVGPARAQRRRPEHDGGHRGQAGPPTGARGGRWRWRRRAARAWSGADWAAVSRA